MSKKTPSMNANQAIAEWAKAHPDQRLDEVEDMSLQFMHPPIKVMSDRLAQLANCKKLSLSTNNIEDIGFLPPRIEILAIGRNMLKKLDKIDKAAATLQQLWMSYNNVKSFAPLAACKRLRVLYAAHNNVDKLSEIDKLSQLPNLEDIVLVGNPLYESLHAKKTYRQEIVKRLKKLTVLDGENLAELSVQGDEGTSAPAGDASQKTGNTTGAASGNGSRSVSPRPDSTSSNPK